MGNCIANNKILSQDHESYTETKVEQMKTSSSSSKLETPRKKQCIEKKVRFKIENDDEDVISESHGNCRSGTVRIRVVMTQEELKRLLSCKDDSQQYTSLEQLLGAMKLRGGKISKVGEYDDGDINSWRPALESIPEDRLIK